jgi:hypothetical protein
MKWNRSLSTKLYHRLQISPKIKSNGITSVPFANTRAMGARLAGICSAQLDTCNRTMFTIKKLVIKLYKNDLRSTSPPSQVKLFDVESGFLCIFLCTVNRGGFAQGGVKLHRA